ncbi:hypothetical protein phiFa_491 [Thermus phage phiFa]|nr:hypothetical protein phiFa_49 [Thermus phage phiFa]QKE11349.1 hypothetical protein phiFa_491 [Thermus phage phiFa]
MAKKVQKKAKAQAQAQAQDKVKGHIVNAKPLLQALGVDAFFGTDADELVNLLNANMNVKNSDQEVPWCTAWVPYIRVDGKVEPGLVWALNWAYKPGPVNVFILRLVERGGGGVKVTATAYASGKMRVRGVLAHALIGAWGLKEWGDDDVAALL